MERIRVLNKRLEFIGTFDVPKIVPKVVQFGTKIYLLDVADYIEIEPPFVVGMLRLPNDSKLEL